MFANSNSNICRMFTKSTEKPQKLFYHLLSSADRYLSVHRVLHEIPVSQTQRRLKLIWVNWPAATKIEYFGQSEKPHQHRCYNCSCLIYQAYVSSMNLQLVTDGSSVIIAGNRPSLPWTIRFRACLERRGFLWHWSSFLCRTMKVLLREKSINKKNRPTYGRFCGNYTNWFIGSTWISWVIFFPIPWWWDLPQT